MGMQADLAAAQTVVTDTYAEASEALGFDLYAMVQDGPAELLNETVNTQDKYPGKWVLNTTSSLMVYAIGGAPGDAWHASTDGLADHTPA